ncbi:MAG: PHP domain-containing protein [Boseongicola sp. SB0664_bin_43]|uniref:PHP domain-containing protein n=1 Tax=Boseongicola sp. SB0664_bin_43 TaxID=2604844 RepID=A0A6B0Y1E4_9RHOB|nr:PHP domain-containing protein [Boseongicola sp. SB0664_bin_43]MYK30275.1 PHP domain-containing protein [Boseongicola sp. SB0670_bin_30]
MASPVLAPGQVSEINLTVTPANKARTPFLEIPFQLPSGMTRLDVGFEYAKAEDCALDIGIMDSRATDYPTRSGFRGWSGSARNEFFVATDAATPGYYAGWMPPGSWKLLLGMYRVPDSGVAVRLTLMADAAPRGVTAMPKPATPRVEHPGWYRGDLHCHTHHSDARGGPELLAESARLAGLDFLAVTDHNTTSQWRYFGPRSSEDLVFIPGMEVTTYRGHANVFGLNEWVDFRLGNGGDLDALVREVRRQGAILSINHDKEPLPWDYDYPDMDCMEVFHGHWLTGNDGVLAKYDRFLADGRRVSLIGGSDYHQPAEQERPGPVGLGKPTTVLWLPCLDAPAVVEALRSGHGYVTESPNGPHLAFTANGQPMGSTVTGSDDIALEVEVTGASGDRLVWVGEAGPVSEKLIPGDAWKETMRLPMPGRFLRAEILADASRAKAIKDLMDWCENRIELPRAQQSLTDAPPIRRTLSNPVYFEAPK